MEHDEGRMARLLTTDDAIAILRKRFYERTEEDVASLVRFLSTDVAFFRRVPPQVIASAAERMEHSRVEGAPGSVMVREGDTNATHAFVILRGHCHVYRRKSGGDGDGDGGGGAGNGAAVVDESVASDDDLGELLDADVTVGDVVGELGAMMGEGGGGGGGDGGAGGGRAVRWRRRNASVVTAPGSPFVDLLAIEGGALRAMARATPTTLFQPKALRRVLSIPPPARSEADVADIVNYARWLEPLRGVPEALLAPLAAAAEYRHVPLGGFHGTGGDAGEGAGRETNDVRAAAREYREWTPGEEIAVVVSGRLIVHDNTPASRIPADELDAEVGGVVGGVGGGVGVGDTLREDTVRALKFRDEWTDPVVGDAMLSGIPIQRREGAGGGGTTGNKSRFAAMARVVKFLMSRTTKARRLSGPTSPEVAGGGQNLSSQYRLSSIRTRNHPGSPRTSGGGVGVDGAVQMMATTTPRVSGLSKRLSITDIVPPEPPNFDVSSESGAAAGNPGGGGGEEEAQTQGSEAGGGSAALKKRLGRTALLLKPAASIGRLTSLFGNVSGTSGVNLTTAGVGVTDASSSVFQSLDSPQSGVTGVAGVAGVAGVGFDAVNDDADNKPDDDDMSDDEDAMREEYGRVTAMLRPGDAYGECDLIVGITGAGGSAAGAWGRGGRGRVTLRACRGRGAAGDRCHSADTDANDDDAAPSSPSGPSGRGVGVDVMVITKNAYDQAVYRVQNVVLGEAVNFLRRVGGGGGGVDARAASVGPGALITAAAAVAGYGTLGTCPESELSRIVFLTRAVTAEKGSVLVREGFVPDGIYFVKRGHLKVTRCREAGTGIGAGARVARMVPVSAFGENTERPGSPQPGGGGAGGGTGGGIAGASSPRAVAGASSPRAVAGASSPRPTSPVPGGLESPGPSSYFQGLSAGAAAARGPLHISAEACTAADKHSQSSALEVGVVGAVDFFGAETVPDANAGAKGSGVAHGAILGLIPASCTVSVSSSEGCELMLLAWRDLQWLSKDTHAAIRAHVGQRAEWWDARARELAAKKPPGLMAAAAAAEAEAEAEAREANAEAEAEALAAEPAENVIKYELRPAAKASYTTSRKSRPGTASGTGMVIPFGVDGIGGFYGAGYGAAAPHKQPPLPTPCLSNAAQVGSTAQYSSRRRRAAAVAANLAVGAPARRGDKPRPATAAAATGIHVAPDKPSAVFAARPVLETDFNEQMDVALNSLAMHSWGSSRIVMSAATAAAEVKTKEANEKAKAFRAAAEAKAEAQAAAAAAADATEAEVADEEEETVAAAGMAAEAVAAGEVDVSRPHPLELPPDSTPPGTPQYTPAGGGSDGGGAGQARSSPTADMRQQKQHQHQHQYQHHQQQHHQELVEVYMPRWSAKTLRASEVQERRRVASAAATARATAHISVSVPFSPTSSHVDHLNLTVGGGGSSGDGNGNGNGDGDGGGGVGSWFGGSGGRSGSGGQRGPAYSEQRPATAGARMSSRQIGTAGRGAPPGGRSPPSMTHRGQPSRPAPPPPQIMAQWAPGAGWSPGNKHGASSRTATGGFKPHGASTVSSQPRFAQPRFAQSPATQSLQSSPIHKSSRMGGDEPGSPRQRQGQVFSASTRRRPSTAQPAPRSGGRPVSGEPRRRLPPTTTAAAAASSSPVDGHNLPSRPNTSGGLVGHRGQSVGGGWYYPVVPAGATSDAAALPPPAQPPTLRQQLNHMAPIPPPRTTPGAGAGAATVEPLPSPSPHSDGVYREPLPKHGGAVLGDGEAEEEEEGDGVAAALAAVMAAETAASAGSAAGVHSWSITSPWDEAAGAGGYLYRDARPHHRGGGSGGGGGKDKSPGRTRLVGAASLGGLPTEMDDVLQAEAAAAAVTHDDDSQGAQVLVLE